MALTVPQHELLEVLRTGAERVVYRSRFQGQATVTRIILRPVNRELAGLIEGVVSSGIGSLAGLDDEIIATLEGYRVRSRLKGPGLPEVCVAGLASDPERCPDWAGLPYITTRWMPGHTLRAAAIPMPQRPGVLRGVLSILAEIHDADVAYGDLKPQNIVLGPEGVGLIDLDTLRQVPAAHLPIRVTHRTPRYAAPEQEGDHPLLYLASDVYTFGLLVCEFLGGLRRGEPGFPPNLGSPWAEMVDACFRSRPLDRPRASMLLAHLESPAGPLTTWSGAPFAPATEPVRASLEHQHTVVVEEPPAPTAQVSEAVAGSHEQTMRVPEPAVFIQPTAKTARKRVSRSLLVFVVGLGLFGIAVVLSAGVFLQSQLRARQQAEAATASLMAELRTHKTVASENTLAVLEGIRLRAEAAAASAETPDLLGLYALCTVWSQKWHYWNATWDAERYAEGSAVIDRARDAGSSPTALLAHGVLAGGACRLMPDAEATLRRSRCEESLTSIDDAWQTVRWDRDEDWLAVEVQWAGVMTGNAHAEHLDSRGDGEGAQSARKAAMARCQSGIARLEAAPVNGKELVESCLSTAGPAERFREYMEWSAWLAGNELEAEGKVSRGTQKLIFESVHTDCKSLDYYPSGMPQPGHARGGPIDLCRYVGMMALGCPDMAESMRDCERESWGLREKRCVVYNQKEGVPWRAALSGADSPLLSDCVLSR